MKILIEENKAKWVDGQTNGRWQKIKKDDKGDFIRKGTEIIYINEYLSKNRQDSKQEKNQPNQAKRVEVKDEHELKVYNAFWESKHFWDKMYNNTSDDYYYYRSLTVGMPRTFFSKK